MTACATAEPSIPKLSDSMVKNALDVLHAHARATGQRSPDEYLANRLGVARRTFQRWVAGDLPRSLLVRNVIAQEAHKVAAVPA